MAVVSSSAVFMLLILIFKLCVVLLDEKEYGIPLGVVGLEPSFTN